MNIATSIMEEMTRVLKSVDGQFKKMATEPYATRKLTEAEQFNLYRNLTPEKMFESIQGMNSVKEFEDFNKWLYRMEQKENKNG